MSNYLRRISETIRNIYRRRCHYCRNRSISMRLLRTRFYFFTMFRFCLLLSLYLVRFTHQLDCQDPVDVIFALDASVDFHQFEQMRNFIVESLGDFNVKDEIVQVAVLSYTSEVIKSRHFNSLQIEDAISQFVYALNIERGKPNVANVLATIRNDFSGTRDSRTSVPMVVVLLSGGGVDNFEQALIESTSLKGENVSIFVAVVGNAFLIPGFYLLASYPFDRNFFHTSNLQSVRANLVGKICNRKTTMCQDYCLERGECVPHDGDVTCSCFPGFFGRFCNALGCTQPVNVFFALTAASSIDIETFLDQIDFVHNVMLNLNLMESKIGFGVYYNNSLEIKLDFQRYETFKGDTKWFQQKVFDAVSSEFKMGYTNLTNVLKVIRQGIFSPGENNVLVLFVSGPSPDIVSSAREAALARNGPAVIQILVVTVGQMYSRDEVNAIAITSGVADYQGVNVFPADKFHTSLITGLVDSICNIKNECASNPCLNSGLCIDFINGYRCFCPSNRIGPHCETEGNEYIDLIFGFDSSGSIRNDEFENILKFAIKIVSQLDISPSKTRVGAVKWNSRAYDLFHLDTYTSLQDVAWAIGQITFEPLNGGTNTSDCLKLIKDVLLKPGQNGERPLARNLVLLFTDGNSNIDDEMTIPLAADLRTSRNARIITLGIGNFTNFNEMTSLCLIPPSSNKDFFIFPSFEFVSIAFDSLFETLLEVESCQDINCQNGGHCEIKRRAVCVCSRSFGGKYCEKSCNRVMDVVFVIDTSGSAQSDVVTNRTVALVREMASFFPLEATKFSVVTFGNYARINFLLRSFNNSQDLMDSLVFKMSVGPQFLGTAIGFLGNSSTVEGPHIFATRNGGRPSSAKVAVIVTSSDSPYEYRDIVQAAGKSRSMGTEIYAVLTSNWPSRELYQAIVDSPSRLFTVNSNNDLSYIAERTFTSICANTK